MKDLEQCRKEIDEIDQQLMKLFEQRMNVSRDVVTYKLAHQMEIFQPEREEAVKIKNQERMENPLFKDYAASFIQDVMNIGKSYQATFIPLPNLYQLKMPKTTNLKVGYSGVPGAFGHQALLEYFGEVENTNYVHFEDVFEALKNDEIDYGIVPLENSSTGAINDNYDLVRDYDFYIVGEHSVSISQHLLAHRGVKIEDLKNVYSHPQGISQSTTFLKQYPNIVPQTFSNTAAAAKYVSESRDLSNGAIASKIAAKLYGLEVLQENINNEATNNTRFIVFGKNMEDSPAADRVSIVFTLSHEVGSLYHILKVIKDHQINLSRIESRPIKDKRWQYYFYIDFEGSLHEDNIKLAIEEMKTNCLTLRVLGNYRHA